jgi:hypothetical protein
MEIGRRGLLAGAGSIGLAGMIGPVGEGLAANHRSPEFDLAVHPLTRSMLDRARRAGGLLERPRVERVIHEVAGEHGRPVIKWLDDPGCAFEHLCRYPLDELTQMPTARLWPVPPRLPAKDEAAAERSLALYLHATRVLNVEEHGRALMAPKLAFKARVVASHSDPEAVFKARAVAAETGWIETSMPASAAQAIRAIEDLLSGGHAEGSMEICHQLRVFEAFEHGLLATWETPEEMVCVPVTAG